MALSASKNYTTTVTAANLIALALRRLGVLDPAESIDSTEETNALVTLNLIVKELMIHNPQDWLRQHGMVLLDDPGDKAIYSLGPGGDKAAFAWYETEVSSAASASDTTVTMATTDDGTHVTDNSHIGIKLDDGSIHTTTINDGSISASTDDEAVTLTTAFPTGTSAAVGNRIYVYNTSSQISRPKKILYASTITKDTTNESALYTAVEGNETGIDIIGYQDYRRISQKLQKGVPSEVHYEATRSTGNLYVWPTGTTGKDYDKVLLTYTVYPDDFDATTNNAQFPPEWHNALAWRLAAEMASEYGLPEQREAKLWAIAQQKVNDLLELEENDDVRFARAALPEEY